MTDQPSSANAASFVADPRLRAFILSGGTARRAGGVNKSFIRVEGKPVIENQLDRLRPAFGDRITIVTDRPADYEPYGVDCIGDLDLPSAGGRRSSLLGIASALSAYAGGWCFLLSNDMPWPDMSILRTQWESLPGHALPPDGALQGVCLESRRGPEPFHAVYHGALAKSAIVALDSDDKSLRRWIAQSVGPRTLSLADLGVDQSALERCLANFNVPPE